MRRKSGKKMAAMILAAAILLFIGDAQSNAQSLTQFDGGTMLVSQPYIVQPNTFVDCRGSTLKAAPGYTGALMQSASLTGYNPNITIRNCIFDGSGSAVYGLHVVGGKNLVIENVEAFATVGNAIFAKGIVDNSQNYSEPQRWNNVYAHDCRGTGIYNGLRTRRVTYTNIIANRCANGFTIDHSEASGTNITTTNNTADGLFIRNVYSVSLGGGIRSTGNGRDGIHAICMVASVGSGWQSQSNGRNDIWFDGGSFNGTCTYGVTQKVLLQDVVAGRTSFVAGATPPAKEVAVRIDAGVELQLFNLRATSPTVNVPPSATK